MIAGVGLEVVKDPEVLLEETPQLEAEALAVGVVVTLKGKEKIKIAAPNLLKDLVARRKRSHAHGLWQETAKIKTVSLNTLRFASSLILPRDATRRNVPTPISPKRKLVADKVDLRNRLSPILKKKNRKARVLG